MHVEAGNLLEDAGAVSLARLLWLLSSLHSCRRRCVIMIIISVPVLIALTCLCSSISGGPCSFLLRWVILRQVCCQCRLDFYQKGTRESTFSVPHVCSLQFPLRFHAATGQSRICQKFGEISWGMQGQHTNAAHELSHFPNVWHQLQCRYRESVLSDSTFANNDKNNDQHIVIAP